MWISFFFFESLPSTGIYGTITLSFLKDLYISSQYGYSNLYPISRKQNSFSPYPLQYELVKDVFIVDIPIKVR